LGVPSCSDLGEGDVGIEVWTSRLLKNSI
jgi:hypothetical protein